MSSLGIGAMVSVSGGCCISLAGDGAFGLANVGGG